MNPFYFQDKIQLIEKDNINAKIKNRTYLQREAIRNLSLHKIKNPSQKEKLQKLNEYSMNTLALATDGVNPSATDVKKMASMATTGTSEADIKEFATEAGINIFYVIPPLNDRERSRIIADFLRYLGIVK